MYCLAIICLCGFSSMMYLGNSRKSSVLSGGKWKVLGDESGKADRVDLVGP